jgi:hypothetical protein
LHEVAEATLHQIRAIIRVEFLCLLAHEASSATAA